MMALLAAAAMLFGPQVGPCSLSWDSGPYVDCSTERAASDDPSPSMFILSIARHP